MDVKTAPAHELQLMGTQTHRYDVGKDGLHIYVTAGRSWVTYDQYDIILEAGQTLDIPPSKTQVIISAANPHTAIKYQIS